MFEPVFKISNKILSQIIDFEKSVAVMEVVPAPIDWEIKLREDSLARRIQSSLRIYGSNIQLSDLNRVVHDDPGRDEKAEEVAKRIGLVSRENELQLVLNYIRANKYKEQLGYLSVRFNQSGFGEKDLIQLNSLLMEKLVPPKELGVFRITELGDGWMAGKMKLPNAVEISYQLEDFFGWMISADKEKIYPILKAGVCLYELLRIQPFEEKNVLTAALFTDLYLSAAGYDLKDMWVWEEEIFKNKELLLEKIMEPEKHNQDLTGWLEYYMDCMDKAAFGAKTKLMSLIGERPAFRSESGKIISLSERQIAIMEDLTLHGEEMLKEIKNILPSVSEDTVLRDLKDLINKRLVKKKGHTRGAKYALGKVKYFR